MNNSNITIKELTTEELDDFLYFFEHVAHTDNKEWDRCYCINYCSDDQRGIEGYPEFNAEQRKAYAVQYIKGGLLKGYLAYSNGAVVGWCNVNDRKDCLHCFGNYFIYGDTLPETCNQKVLSIFCFTVAPEYRGRHIATMLLERVISDAQIRGYEYLECYPEKGAVDQYYNYCGPEKLYTNAGFHIYGETEKRNIMRKSIEH